MALYPANTWVRKFRAHRWRMHRAFRIAMRGESEKVRRFTVFAMPLLRTPLLLPGESMETPEDAMVVAQRWSLNARQFMADVDAACSVGAQKMIEEGDDS